MIPCSREEQKIEKFLKYESNKEKIIVTFSAAAQWNEFLQSFFLCPHAGSAKVGEVIQVSTH